MIRMCVPAISIEILADLSNNLHAFNLTCSFVLAKLSQVVLVDRLVCIFRERYLVEGAIIPFGNCALNLEQHDQP